MIASHLLTPDASAEPRILDALRTVRVLWFSREWDGASEVARRLTAAGVAHVRDYHLSRTCRADFIARGGIVIDVNALHRTEPARMVRRYTSSLSVRAVILLVSGDEPSRRILVDGKPVTFLNITTGASPHA